MYKLLALDLDDTTLCHDGTLSQKNKEAIEKVKQNNGHVIIITGRSTPAARKIWQKIKTNDICVCFGGAQIVNMKENKVLHTSALSPELVTEALCFAKDLGVVAQIYVDDKVVTEYKNPSTDRYINYLGLDMQIEPDIRSKRFFGIPKLLCFTEEHNQKDILKKFEEHFKGRCEVSASTKIFVELNKLGMNKGTALLKLCEMLNVDISETVAMGDSLLDAPMIKTAGVGIAVENASDEVKAIADFIAPDCDSDAVYWAVEKFFN